MILALEETVVCCFMIASPLRRLSVVVGLYKLKLTKTSQSKLVDNVECLQFTTLSMLRRMLIQHFFDKQRVTYGGSITIVAGYSTSTLD